MEVPYREALPIVENARPALTVLVLIRPEMRQGQGLLRGVYVDSAQILANI